MARIELEYCSLHYLNQWPRRERSLFESFRHLDRDTRLEAIAEAASFFKVARNLPEKYDTDEGKQRYQPILKIMDALEPSNFIPTKFVTAVQRVRDKVSQKYGGREVLSVTSKLLWLKFRSPIIIYDKRARTALNVEPGNYEEYCSRWLERFETHQQVIKNACDQLPPLRKYCSDPDLATESYIRKLASDTWFRHRVFDIHLWHAGA